MEEVQQRLSIHNEMVRASEVNYDVIVFGVQKYSQSEVLIWFIDAMKLAFNFFQMKSSSKPIPEDDSSCETVVRSQQCDARQHEEADEISPSEVVEEKFQRTNSEHYEEQEILLNQQRHIQVTSIVFQLYGIRGSNNHIRKWLLFLSPILSIAITS